MADWHRANLTWKSATPSEQDLARLNEQAKDLDGDFPTLTMDGMSDESYRSPSRSAEQWEQWFAEQGFPARVSVEFVPEWNSLDLSSDDDL